MRRGPLRSEVAELTKARPVRPQAGREGWFVAEHGPQRVLRWWDGGAWTNQVWRDPGLRGRAEREPLPREKEDLRRSRPSGPNNGEAGWFLDPRHAGRLCWWDGMVWTETFWSEAGVGTDRAAERRKPGSFEAQCPVCQERGVEVAAELKTIRGKIAYCELGTQWSVGCRGCVAGETWKVAMVNLLLGWWSFPWGLTTPGVVIGNLWRGLLPRRSALRRFGAVSGVDLMRYEIGKDYLTGEERNLVSVLLVAAGRVGRATSRPAIGVIAVEFAEHSLLGGEVPREHLLGLGVQGEAVLDGVEPEVLLAYLRLLGRAVEETGGVDAGAVREIAALIVEFGLDVKVEDILGSMRSQGGGYRNGGERRETRRPRGEGGEVDPYRTLGLQPGAGLKEVKARHREMILRNHPDRVQAAGGNVAEATRRTQEINAAYQAILQDLGRNLT